MQITRLPAADVLASLKTSEAGLDSAEAQRRLREFGPNCIEEVKGKPLWLRFLREFTHFFALILWVAATLAFFAETRDPGAGMWQLGAAILAVILINGVFSFLQEYRAERAISALRQLLPPHVKVFRDGELQTLAADLLVPGDLVLLEEGDNVPADCRLVEASGVRVNLSTITGEALPAARSAEGVADGRPLEARNILLAGTFLVSGQAKAVVYATGMLTEFGKIAHLTQTVGETGSPLQREIGRLSKLVAVIASALGLLFFGIGVVMGLPFWANAMFAIGIIVANVPEGLLPTVTLSLAMATQRMARRNALVRHLPSVETLGSTTVICCDKTGTLTQNTMSVRRVYVPRLPTATDDLASVSVDVHMLRNTQHCHNLKRSTRDGRAQWLGDPMEVALVEFGRYCNDFGSAPVVGEIPFDGERRRMSVIVDHGGRRWLYCKGAPEAVLALCDRVDETGAEAPLDDAKRQRVTQSQNDMAGRDCVSSVCASRTCRRRQPEAGLVFGWSGCRIRRDPRCLRPLRAVVQPESR
jgi:sodium/potassium-transporting ATPase subunit alpha